MRDVDAMMYVAGDQPDSGQTRELGGLSHHSNNKTNLLSTFQVHNLLTGTLPVLLSTFFINKKRCKTLKTRFLFTK